ncbi:MAG: PIN domain-containing protein [Candidatus Aminicenantes bacterium]|nr:PIN domain-containing protein [Candidatus Aminicenantes bacterium]NIM81650.1 PIN domain-containing protein [Candidatus Aminicenantes bacterium]NIN21020.1 PIN domain-containing protein [Candidatus Aminicenantes bacterium]NIN44841.1 PIN domain-containing protein [Candidatus Aminicenantes bacterium]NIN87649.1 PIN domain-containing protein [Candidatus Aminicenantes bacterium]
MVIDTSALVAILLGEPEAKKIARAIANDNKRLISAFSFLKSSIVIESKKGEDGARELDLLINKIQLEIISMNSAQTEAARKAWREFGKGRHPAALNIGDCCAYALAKITGEPLLFKGDDFSKTDISLVSYLNQVHEEEKEEKEENSSLNSAEEQPDNQDG